MASFFETQVMPVAIRIDPRYFQICFLILFLGYGIIFLHWNPDLLHYTICIGGCLIFNIVFEWQRNHDIRRGAVLMQIRNWGLSSLITGLSLCLLLKTNHWYTSAFAVFFAVASKYVIRIKGRHIFNPSAFGIALTILVTRDAWLSPAQWGNAIALIFFIIILGIIVVTRVQKLDTSMAFLAGYCGLLYFRQVLVLGWPLDFFFHSISSGALMLFSFFMISDPKTSPSNAGGRILWALMIAVIAFYLSTFWYVNNAALWSLVIMAPSIIFIDRVFKSDRFDWKLSTISLPHIQKLKIRL